MKDFEVSLIAVMLLMTGCASIRQVRGPVWFVPAENTSIYGVGVNVFTLSEVKNADVNGARIELIGPGVLIPLVPDTSAPCWETREEYLENLSAPGEDVRGLEISGAGTVIRGHVVGVSLGLLGSIKNKVTGLVGTLGWNTARDVTGIQFGGFNTTYRTAGIQIGCDNRASELHGIQIGMTNGCRDGHGIQIGLWNSNERRSLPFINWAWHRREVRVEPEDEAAPSAEAPEPIIVIRERPPGGSL